MLPPDGETDILREGGVAIPAPRPDFLPISPGPSPAPGPDPNPTTEPPPRPRSLDESPRRWGQPRPAPLRGGEDSPGLTPRPSVLRSNVRPRACCPQVVDCSLDEP